MGSTFVFLPVRVLHVLLAASWLGATLFMAFVVMPAIDDSGNAGDQVMVNLGKRGIAPFFGVLGGLTVLTGIYLYWRFTGGFDPVISKSSAGMAFGVGGVAGLLAVILGGSVVGRSANKAVELLAQAAKMPDGAQKTAILQQVTALKQRMSSFGGIVLLLQAVATVLMALGHYI